MTTVPDDAGFFQDGPALLQDRPTSPGSDLGPESDPQPWRQRLQAAELLYMFDRFPLRISFAMFLAQILCALFEILTGFTCNRGAGGL